MRIDRTTGHNASKAIRRIAAAAATGDNGGTPEPSQPASTPAAASLPVPLRASPRSTAGHAHRVRSNSAVLAQLIAGQLGMAQTRAKRRNGPAETAAAYAAVSAGCPPAPGRRVHRCA